MDAPYIKIKVFQRPYLKFEIFTCNDRLLQDKRHDLFQRPLYGQPLLLRPSVLQPSVPQWPRALHGARGQSVLVAFLSAGPHGHLGYSIAHSNVGMVC